MSSKSVKPTALDDAVVTNKVPLQAKKTLAPLAPPIALPGGSVGAYWSPTKNPLGPRPEATTAAFTRELSVWPKDSELSEAPVVEATASDSTRKPKARTTQKSLRTRGPIGADFETAPSMKAPVIAAPPPEEATLAPKRKGLPRMELRVPTGWGKSVTPTDIKRRKAKATPARATPTPENPRKRLMGWHFAAIMIVIAILNTPLLIVAWNSASDFFTEETVQTELSLGDLVRIEIDLEARPQDGDEILEAAGIDRHRWSALRGAVTADPDRSAEFQSIRSGIESD